MAVSSRKTQLARALGRVVLWSPLLVELRSRLLWGPGALGLGFVVLVLTGSIFLASPSPAQTAVSEYWLAALSAASRHNTLEGVSNEAFASWLIRVLRVEMGEESVMDNRLLFRVWYPLWLKVQALKNDLLGTNDSAGPAQLRPETVQQLRQGWIVHGGRRIEHGVKLAYPVEGGGPYGTSSQRLLDPAVALEYLAANLAMGAAVARAFGYEPTLEDLARWHNTGVGRWTPQYDLAWWGAWRKGERYLERVVRLPSPLKELQEGPTKVVGGRWRALSWEDDR